MLSLLAVLCGTSYAAQEVSFDFTSVENLKTYGVTTPPAGKGKEADFVAFTNQGVSFSTVNGSSRQRNLLSFGNHIGVKSNMDRLFGFSDTHRIKECSDTYTDREIR